MNKFLLLYKGPATSPDASHDGWPQWFTGLGEHLLDVGSPMKQGYTLHGDGSADESATPLNGYSIIQAEERAEAFRLVQSHPYLSLGDEYTVEIFALG
ncbi:hypothetical protein [Dictyobacter arantiisoli]|uniref:YCII-related domain-containing protein n=1 Tax=Dictyobacter arantiisoli TaxID=2014874 RepID=A0A5A5TEF9_9CHLR|nr:hypothetical protein [Dictyobacter arantiisoli]GCF09628.1 hypothetical protein KDI_31920 [Dictyobacter arantiisoli]